MVSFRRHALVVHLLLSFAVLGLGACATAPEEPAEDLASARQALDPVCVTLRRGEAGDVVDTFLSGDYPTWAPGSDWGVWTGVSSAGNINRALFGFDLSPIPAGASVESATFTVFQSWSASYNEVSVHRVTGPWSEATTTAANFDPAFIQAAPETSFAVGDEAFRDADVTALVREWVSGETPNHGLALQEPPVNRHYFYTSEIPTAARRPSLTVCYTESTCDDGVQSPGEVGVDCGGPCEPCVCTPGSTVSCYTGPEGTEGVGACAAGTWTCNAEGSGYGQCTGDVHPAAESCATTADDDCDGEANEGCVCVPNAVVPCYTGPAGTAGVGICQAGTATCNADGTALGPCVGQVLPAAESCANGADDDCDGAVNDGCSAAACALYSESFDDGHAGEITSGNYKIGWCDTQIPGALSTPLCMLGGRALRTFDAATDPTLWVSRGETPCTAAKISYSYHQLLPSGTTLQYQRSSDTAEVCEKTGTFTNALTHPAILLCASQSATVTFDGSSSIYFRFNHPSGNLNALFIDNVSVELLGCTCD